MRLNLNQKISKKERIMLSVLATVVIGVGYYQLIYSNIDKFLQKKAAEKEEIETKYNNALEAVNTVDTQKSNLKMINAKINDEALPLYPTISQEHIILEIDELLKEYDLIGGIEFEDEKVDTVPILKKSDKDTGIVESSLQGSADKYNNKFGQGKSDTSESNDDSDNNTANNSENIVYSKTLAAEGSEESKDDKKRPKVSFMEGKIKFYGTYENVTKFIKAIDEREKKMAAYGIGMDINDNERIKGELGIGIYSIPKVNDEIKEYLKWDMENTYGKAEPFQLNQAAGTGIKSDKVSGDFKISVKPTSSDLPSVIVGKSNDSLRRSYVYGDGNDDQDVEMQFVQEGDKYFYKYKTTNGSIPSDYDTDKCEFSPIGQNIVIDISSERRENSKDKSGIKLKISNSTDKLIKVNIEDDDKNKPRVSIDGDKPGITVNRK